MCTGVTVARVEAVLGQESGSQGKQAFQGGRYDSWYQELLPEVRRRRKEY